VNVPSEFKVRLPWLVVSTRTAVSGVWLLSVSLARTLFWRMVVSVVPSAVVKLSLVATGACSTGVTVRLTV
jgi:hypothetical protein